jgi:hypothetical protein
MQRTRTINSKLKETVETQTKVIEKCIKRIIELETHIVSIDICRDGKCFSPYES